MTETCPFCGADRKEFFCGETSSYSNEWNRSVSCYNRQIAALQAALAEHKQWIEVCKGFIRERRNEYHQDRVAENLLKNLGKIP